jgi:glyoxylase-like metal-dependent hydrolase (beta-lactamase superfamily II)
MRTPVTAVAVLTLSAVAPAGAAAQSAGTLAESYARGRAIVDAAVAAHGGVDALRAARQVRVAMAGHDLHRNQSKRAAAPYDREPHTVDLMIDLARARLSFERAFAYPGGATRTQRFISDSARGFIVDRKSRTHRIVTFPPVETQYGNLFYLPQFVLLAARDNPGQLRALGRVRLSSGAPVEAVVAAVPNGMVTLGFDPETRRLRALLSVRGDALAGDVASETEFVGWREVNGVSLPERRVTRVAGEVTQDLAYTGVTPGFSMPDSLAAPPSWSTLAPRTPTIEPARALAPGVWAVGGTGPNALVVAFTDHVLVVDAPGFGTEQLIERVATLAPGKPIRYVVPTHHHDDHAGGVRHFAAAGATIVTTPGNRAYMERMAAARPTLAGDARVPAAARARVETMTARRVFTDGARTVEIHDIGPGPHAQEMLVAWIPEERILFQGDLIDVGPGGAVLPGTNNETTAHFAEWLRGRGWDVRVFGGSHGFLADAAAFAELLRQPVAQP